VQLRTMIAARSSKLAMRARLSHSLCQGPLTSDFPTKRLRVLWRFASVYSFDQPLVEQKALAAERSDRFVSL
jgi:hypothetical protein